LHGRENNMLKKLGQQTRQAERKDQHEKISEPDHQEKQGKDQGKPTITKPCNDAEKPILESGMVAVNQQMQLQLWNAQGQDDPGYQNKSVQDKTEFIFPDQLNH